MPQVPGVWRWSKNIFADMTFRTSCCKSAAPGFGWAIYKTQLWSSVARLGMPQADQTSCSSFLETSQHLQKLLPVCSGPPGFMVAHAARTTWGYPAYISIKSFFLRGAFCSSLITGLCPMVLISNFHPVSSHYNLILPSDFFFSCDFMSYSPWSLSIPLFCVWHTV